MIFSFILSFLASFIVAELLLQASAAIAKRYRIFPPARARDTHEGEVTRLGGVAIFFSFWTIVFLHPLLIISPLLWGIFGASIILFGGSFLDDMKEQGWIVQLCFQIAALMPLMLMGMSIEFIRIPFWGILSFPHLWGNIAAALWILFTINAFNWLDGLDGLAAGVGLMAVSVLFFLSLNPQVNQPPLAILNAVMAGTLAAFLKVNVPPAKIFLGTSGALFLGLFLGTQAIVAGGKLATLSLVLAPFFLDALWVIVKRLQKHHSPFRADLSHLHFQLFRKGFGKRTILFMYLIASGVLGVLSLLFGTWGKFITFALCIIIFIAARLFFTLDVSKKETYNTQYGKNKKRRNLPISRN